MLRLRKSRQRLLDGDDGEVWLTAVQALAERADDLTEGARDRSPAAQ